VVEQRDKWARLGRESLAPLPKGDDDMGLKEMAIVGHLRRRATLLLMAMAAALMLSSGVALAVTITCQATFDCLGTSDPDTLEGSAGNDYMYARGSSSG